jgi:hypothetical protein
MFQIGKAQHERGPANTQEHADAGINETNQENSGNRSNENERNSSALFDSAEKHSGIFLVIVTALLVIATGFLWKATRDLVRGAEETTERQLRAYVFVDAVEIRNFGTQHPPAAAYRVKNTGQTPAYELRNHATIAIGPFPFTDFPRATWIESSTSLGPGCEVETGIAAPNPLTTERQAAVVNGSLAIYVSCQMCYWDVFRKVERFTNYRGFYRGNGITPVAGSILPLSQTAEGNDAN